MDITPQSSKQAHHAVREGSAICVKAFAPGRTADGHDRQQPHTRDELYFVQSGQGEIIAHEPRLENFLKDFVTRAVFYGPQGGE
ncbi:MAG: hypothetical protein Q8R06_13895 [Polaromonas sp.]|uniref:hypothetical protein n=1 Tax=Polaromonas sp. TaxID=1869339 RepID=UPI0027374C21|nr:hypothetical protein [Polaromonas sp.]MDP3798218.1 hypothetical protein [Polaromonas sp.]